MKSIKTVLKVFFFIFTRLGVLAGTNYLITIKHFSKVVKPIYKELATIMAPSNKVITAQLDWSSYQTTDIQVNAYPTILLLKKE